MHAMRMVSPFLFFAVVLAGLSWVGHNSSTVHTPQMYKHVVESIPHRRDPLIIQTSRADKPDVWPKALSLQWEDWTSDTSLLDLTSTLFKSLPARIDVVDEWISALSAGLFSTVLCLMFLFICGVQPTWTSAFASQVIR